MMSGFLFHEHGMPFCLITCLALGNVLTFSFFNPFTSLLNLFCCFDCHYNWGLFIHSICSVFSLILTPSDLEILFCFSSFRLLFLGFSSYHLQIMWFNLFYSTLLFIQLLSIVLDKPFTYLAASAALLQICFGLNPTFPALPGSRWHSCLLCLELHARYDQLVSDLGRVGCQRIQALGRVSPSKQ